MCPKVAYTGCDSFYTDPKMSSIEDPAVIAHILKHLKKQEALKTGIQPRELPLGPAPAVTRLFDWYFPSTLQA